MLPIGIDFGTKDAILALAVLVILGMTVIFHWSVWEFVITEAMIILAFHAGEKKQDKRIEDKYKRMKKRRLTYECNSNKKSITFVFFF